MAEQEIVQNMIARAGQSQADRDAAALDPAYAPIDARGPAQLLGQARALAAQLRYYKDRIDTSDGDWSAYIPPGDDEALLARTDGGVAPHLALLAAFAQLHEHPRNALNRFTERQLDFQWRRVLGFTPRPAQADHAHAVLELKKGAEPVAVTPGQEFLAGKDEQGVERVVRAVREAVISHAKVAQLKSVYREAGRLHVAPVADSADGVGTALTPQAPAWRPFGHAGLPLAQPGFAVAAPLLRLAEGERRITLTLTLGESATEAAAALPGAFEAYLTGPRGWIGPLPLTGSLRGDALLLTLGLDAAQPAVVDHDAVLHGGSYATAWPVLQLQLKAGARYADFEALTLAQLSLAVQVRGMGATLALENDAGPLNPKRAFQPFGAQPSVGSRFMVGCPEALSKPLTDIKVRLAWQAAPANLHDWYIGYGARARLSNGISAALLFEDGAGQQRSAVIDLMARQDGVSILSPDAPPPGGEKPGLGDMVATLERWGTTQGSRLARDLRLRGPMGVTAVAAPLRAGFITVQLNEDFLHADYRRETVANAVAQNRVVLNEPYTPTVQAIALDYDAQSPLVDLTRTDRLEDFAGASIQFFQVGCFGPMREHAFLRAQFPFLNDHRVRLLPPYSNEAEFFIGVSALAAGDSLSLLLQALPGSGDPELAAPAVQWAVLCDNHWRELGRDELPVDTTQGLLGSGVVALTVPHEATTEHSLMPGGLIWLRAAVAGASRAMPALQAVAANAVELRFEDRGTQGTHLATALPAGSVKRLATPLPQVKKVTQPFAGFGGRPAESDRAMRRRAAERLRHRNRCITAWDYERSTLEAFPNLHKVKCIAHAGAASWLAPGQVMLVVIPDQRQRSEADALRPRVDLDSLQRIQQHLQARAPLGITISVKNPLYQAMQLDFKVRMRAGFSFNHYRAQLQQELLRLLTPWAFDATRPVEFGGQVFRSVLLDRVEELPYVDFVTDFRLHLADAQGSFGPDRSEAGVSRPDAILVSAPAHLITEVVDP